MARGRKKGKRHLREVAEAVRYTQRHREPRQHLMGQVQLWKAEREISVVSVEELTRPCTALSTSQVRKGSGEEVNYT